MNRRSFEGKVGGVYNIILMNAIFFLEKKLYLVVFLRSLKLVNHWAENGANCDVRVKL